MKPSAERPIGELFGDLARDTETLVQQEMTLARTELSEKAAEAAREGAMVGAGSVVLHVGLASVAAACIAALTMVMALWMAALLVGLVLIGVGYTVARTGVAGLRRIDPLPTETIKTMKENRLWAKRELSR